MSDSTQAIVNTYSYDAFGNIVNQTETVPQPFKFVGQYGVMTEPNGFYYMRARYYDPEVGRFISEDPIGFEGGDVNLCVYASNNPLIYTDPYGLINNNNNNAQGIGQGKLWLAVGLEIVAGTVIGVGMVIEAPVVIAGGAIAGVAVLAYEGYQAYKEGKYSIETYNKNLQKATCNNQ
jgi:RHS repeat-associated protein